MDMPTEPPPGGTLPLGRNMPALTHLAEIVAVEVPDLKNERVVINALMAWGYRPHKFVDQLELIVSLARDLRACLADQLMGEWHAH